MPLECFRSLNKIQTEDKTKNESKAKLQMFYTEVYNITPRRKKNSSKIRGETHSTEVITEKSPKHRQKLGENERLTNNSQKIKCIPRKRIRDSHSCSPDITYQPKRENKSSSLAKREIIVNKKQDFSIKQIPVKEDLEISIERSHCPMVVRIHRGELNKSERKKGIEKLHSVISQSHSCPPGIEINPTSSQKDKLKKSKYRYSISELLNLSPRKSGVVRTDNKLNILNGSKSHNSNHKKLSRNKCKLQNNIVNDRISVSVEDNKNKDSKKKHQPIKKIEKPQKILEKKRSNKSNAKSGNLPVEFYVSEGCTSPDLWDDDSDVNTYSSLNPRKSNCSAQEDDQLQNLQKVNSGYTMSEASHNMLEPTRCTNDKMYEPQEYFKLEKVPSNMEFVSDNIVRLDASQSQFYKLSSFLNNCLSKYNDNTSVTDQLNLSSADLVLCSCGNDQDDIKNVNILHANTCGKMRKIISEEIHGKEASTSSNGNENQPGSSSTPSRLNQSFNSLNNNYISTPPESVGEKSKNISSSEFKCLSCNKSTYNIVNYGLYCSDCNLQAKLSQISNESTSTSQDSEEIKEEIPSMKALTTIPESDISLSKQLINVAIQTESDIAVRPKKATVKTSTTEHKITCGNSWENMFKLYCSMASEMKKIQKQETSNVEDLSSSSTSNVLQSLKRDNYIGSLVDQNMFAKEIQVNECIKNSLEQRHSYFKQRKPSPSDVRLEWPKCHPMEPNLHSYGATTKNKNLDKDNSSSDHRSNTFASSFVSPIFPEKEYCRIAPSNHPCLLTVSSKETFRNENLTKSLYRSQEYVQSIRDVQRSNKELNDRIVQNEVSPPRNDIKPVVGSYIHCEKRIIFDKTPTDLNSYLQLRGIKYFGENHNVQSFCHHGTLPPQHKKKFLTDLPFSVMNKKDSLILLNGNAKSEKNKLSRENREINTSHTSRFNQDLNCETTITHRGLNCQSSTQNQDLICELPIKHQDQPITNTELTEHHNMNCGSLKQSQQSQHSTEHLRDCSIMSLRTSKNDQQEIVCIKNQEENFLKSEMPENMNEINNGTKDLPNTSSLNSAELNNYIYTSKLDLSYRLKRLHDPAEVRVEGHKQGIAVNCKDSFISNQVSSKIVGKSKMNKILEGGQDARNMFESHSFSYIFFNISLSDDGESAPDIEETSKMDDFSQTSFILLPETTATHKELNDVVLGNIIKAPINDKSILIKEKTADEFNILEVKALSEVDVGEGNYIQETNSEKSRNLENKPTVYKTISPNIKVHKFNKTDDIEEKLTNSVTTKTTDFITTDQNQKINFTHGKTNNKAIKKNSCVKQIENKTNNKKSRGEKKKLTKINQIFMCSYMAQMSFFRYMGGLQSKVCSEIKK